MLRPEIIKKILEESTGSNFSDIGCNNILLDMSPEARETKGKINYWGYIKIKSFYTVKETINKTKRQPIEWEQIFANDISDERLISKLYKALTQFNTKKPKPIKNGRRHEQTFLQRRHTDDQQTHEKMLNTAHYQRKKSEPQ